MAALLLGGFFGNKKQASAAAGPAMQLTEVLVASSDLDVGHAVKAEDLKWQKWPTDAVAASYITKDANPAGLENMVGAVARTTMFAGEPATASKLVHAESSSFMAAVLTPGMRAVAVEIKEETGAGGFILPNDRVDVILTRRDKSPDKGGPEVVNSEIILPNVRVLAIDQAPKEKDGQNSLVGRTVTLELKPEQAETLARARQAGTLSLALRSIADVNMAENNTDEVAPRKGASINVVRYGVQSSTTTQK